MDICQKCGQAICQSGYRVRLGEYTCANCLSNEWKKMHLAKYGRLWPIRLAWNNLLSWIVASQFLKTEVVVSFLSGVGNEVGEFQQNYSELTGKLRVKLEYINRSGEIELCFWGFKEYDDATVAVILDKFTHKLVKVITIRGDYSNVVKLTESMTELLKSGVQFREVVCHC